MRQRLRRPLQSFLATLLRTAPGLRLVNAAHRALTPAARRRFFYLCADMPRGIRAHGVFNVTFAGRRVRLPLSPEFPDSWSTAVAFDGHDPELHVLYAAMATGPKPPRVMFDVGANYGLHALRFLVRGARAVAFEPNPACHRYFRAACEANGVRCELEPVAVGDRADSVVLAFPEDQTYMGSIVPRVQERWSGSQTRMLTVPQVTLDDVAATRGLVPDLVKIDTEGAEPAVLRGARKLLETARPTLIFESWRSDDERHGLWTMLQEHDYAVGAVGADAARALMLDEFLASDSTNFVAEVPPGRVIHSARQ
jgi:FkbM family methyltransferase